jgi:hypothetical protein
MGAFDVFAITSGTEKCRKRSSKRVGAAAGRRDRCRRHTDYGGRRESPFIVERDVLASLVAALARLCHDASLRRSVGMWIGME